MLGPSFLQTYGHLPGFRGANCAGTYFGWSDAANRSSDAVSQRQTYTELRMRPAPR